jgi:hypothetical protein
MESTVSGVPQQQKKRPEGHYEGVALLRFLPLGAQFVVCVLLVIFLQGAYTYAQVRTCQPCTSPHLLPFCSTNPVFGWAHHTICRSCSSPLRSSLIGATSTRFYYFFTFKCLFYILYLLIYCSISSAGGTRRYGKAASTLSSPTPCGDPRAIAADGTPASREAELMS